MHKPIAILLALATCLVAAALAAFQPVAGLDRIDEERAAVERAVLDYVEAIYEVKPELIDRGVHESLAKYGFWRGSADEAYRGMGMDFAQLRELASKWNEGGQRAGPDAIKQVEVLDLLDQTASAKLTASWGVDYMHLARFGDEWKIVQVLWQSHPIEEDGAEQEG